MSSVRRGTAVLALALGASALLAPGSAHAADEQASMGDDFFEPKVIRVEPGDRVVWSNDGRNPHTVTADGRSWGSGNMEPGATFARAFPEPGVFPFFCEFHGAPEGRGMAGVVLVGDADLPPAFGDGAERDAAPPPGRVVRVPEDVSSIQAAVNTAEPGDLVLISPGVYREAVRVTTPFLTIRGTERNRVILDGGLTAENGIHVLGANGVAIENMTARRYLANGFYWTGVEGYRASYLTAYANGDYGVYAFDSVRGRFERSYAAGHPDSGFYIGQCRPCHAVVAGVLAEDNALGYSGTNAGGDLWIANSVWRDNMSGIVPNTLDSEKLAPQRGVVIAGNIVTDNNNRDAPAKPLQYPGFGIGILVAGGSDNHVHDNLVTDHDNYGIAVLPNLDDNLWISERNRVEGNRVTRSGRADLVLGAPAGKGNCFSGNDAGTNLPPGLEVVASCRLNVARLGGGDLSSAFQTLGLYLDARDGDFPHGDWRTHPGPATLASMPGEVTTWRPGARMPGPRPDVRSPVAMGSAEFAARGPSLTLLGMSLTGASWWQLLLGVYGYVLPLALFAAWVAIALWDLVRREDLSGGGRIGWLAAVLLVPFLGPILYLAFGGSPIRPAMRTMLVAGGIGAYALVTAVAFAVGSS